MGIYYCLVFYGVFICCFNGLQNVAQFRIIIEICRNKSDIMAITYLLRGTKDVKKVYVHVTKGRNDLKVVSPTKFTIEADYWDKETKRAKVPSTIKGAEKNKLKFKLDKFNAELSEFDQGLHNYFDALNDSGELSEMKILNFINGKGNKAVSDKFTDFVEYYIDERIGLSDGTKKVYTRTKNRVNEKFPRLRMNDIDNNFKKTFAEHFDKNKYQRSYLRKTLTNIRDFWKFAKAKKINVSDDPEFWDISKEFPDLQSENYEDIYLTLEELEEIKKPELSDYLDNARDWLIISCWTSLRISDFMGLKADKIFEQNGSKYIVLIPQKTKGSKKELTIPLFKEVEKILEKRNGEFPRQISHQKYNDYLKKIGEKAGLKELVYGCKKRQSSVINGKTVYRNEVGYFEKWELLTSHIGRRSFISNFLRLVDYEKIQKISGHSHFAMVDLYNKTTNLQKAEDLKNEYKKAGIE